MEAEARRELEILSTIGEGRPVTQRALSRSLGIALGLTNLCLKRLAGKGYIKLSSIPPNRVRYLLTPAGLARKTRLTYAYMRYSLDLYRDARQTLRVALGPLARDGTRRVALYGTGEAAELAYLTLKELGLEPAGVFADGHRGTFLGLPVQDPRGLSGNAYDRVVIASFDDPRPHLLALARHGLPRDVLVPLRPSGTGPRRPAGEPLRPLPPRSARDGEGPAAR